MWLAFIIATVVVAIDQYTKYLALHNLQMGDAVQIWGDALQLVLAKNSGAAFSMLSGSTWVFTIISATVSATVIYFVVSGRVKETKWAVVSGLILAGAVGNLIDRVFREPGFAIGHVIDFIFTPWIVPAIYNVADISIVVGMGLFLIFTIFSGKQADEKTAQSSEQTDA